MKDRSHIWFDRFWSVAGAVSIRTKILGIILGLVFVLGIGITLQVRAMLTHVMNEQLAEQSVSVARDLAARATDPILINNLYALHQLLAGTLANNSNVNYAFIIDTQGRVIDHTFGDGFPLNLLQANTVTNTEHHSTIAVNTDLGLIWDTAVPVFDGRAGIARVGISETSARRAVDNVTGQLLVTTVLVFVIAISAGAFLTWLITRPILNLVHATQAIGEGNFAQRVKRWADDEIGELSEAFNQMARALERAQDEHGERERMRAQYVNGVIAAQEDERKRIARELHDSTSQSLTSLLVGLRTLSDSCGQPEILQRSEELRDIASRTLDEVHTLALQLRPSVLDDLGLAAAIERYVSDCRTRYGLQIDLAMRGMDDRLPSETETALYRITQEAITNIIRHANARSASVLIERQNDSVRAIIEDDGCGFDTAITAKMGEQRLGLYGMRERAELLNGKMTIESESGLGTSLFIEIPLANHIISPHN